MRRRDLLAVLAGAVALRASVSRAQRGGEPVRIGIIIQDRANAAGAYDGLMAGLRELGFVDGQNIVGQVVSLRQPRPAVLADIADIVRSGAVLLVALGPELALQAAISAGGNLPVVFVAVNYDPIARGYAQTLARPGGRATGFFIRQPELAEKQVQLLSDAFPDRRRLGILWDALSDDQFQAAHRGARLLGLDPLPVQLKEPPYDFHAAFAALAAQAPEFLLVLSSPRFTASRSQIAELAVQHRLPSMFILRTYVEAGGLISYGYELTKAARQAAAFVKKVLDGAKPANLPIEQPTTYQLVVNLKTAEALGVTLPQSLLGRADEVIE
jgi:putative tryptophan/tyrosine transport system substrate-binding protein